MMSKWCSIFLLFCLFTIGISDSIHANDQHRHGHRRGKNKSKNHVHKWKGHKSRRDGKDGNWQNRWHGGRGFNKHAAHMWHKYGWFWENDTKSWFQCTPVEDATKGYGCEYKGQWYPMVKEDQTGKREARTGRNSERWARKNSRVEPTVTVTSIEEVDDENNDEDLVELDEDNGDEEVTAETLFQS